MSQPATATNFPDVLEHECVELVVDASGIVQELKVPASALRIAGLLATKARFLDQVHPDERDFVGTNMSWALTNLGRKAQISFRLARPDGRWSNVKAHIHKRDAEAVEISLQSDNVVYARNAESQLRRVVEGSLQGIVVICEGETLYCNEGYARMLGYASARELPPVDPSKIGDSIHPDDRQMVFDRLARLEATSRYEFRLLQRSGAIIWVHVTSIAMKWDGRPASLAWLTDVTERKKAEEDLRKSKEEAEFANRSKTTFLANMSHELRTPLNAILGFSEVIQAQMMGPLGSPKYLEYAGDIHKSGEHLLDLINDLLDLAKIDAGKMELRECEFALDEVVSDCVTLMNARAQSGAISLRTEIALDGPGLRADRRAVKQVLLNFLSNAIKFTPSGGHVSIAGCMGTKGTFALSVTDDGIGMTAAEVEVALSPFGQIDSKLARQHVGTGLGLPVTRSLMQLHGGDVVVTSAPGAGTTMTAVFPPERVILRML